MASMFIAAVFLFAGATAVEVEVGVGGVMRSQAEIDRRLQDKDQKEYEEHRKKHGRAALPEGEDPLSFAQRFGIFKKTKAKVEAHNANPSKSWWATIDNHLADYTDSEFNALLGLRRLGRWWEKKSQSLSQVKPDAETAPKLQVKSSMDWRNEMSSTYSVKDQANCGSCWAVAAVGALEVHAQIAAGASTVMKNVSFKQVVDCTDNPHHCGGAGGCDGATSELAFDYVQKHGVHDFTAYAGDINKDKPCMQSKISSQPYLRITGYERLETNKLEPLLQTLSNVGPASVSVDASGWSWFGGGIYDGCNQANTVVNHAVLAVGYGGEGSNAYWLLRNSWGKNWGDHGFIKIRRHAKGIAASSPGQEDDANWKDAHCSWDTDPKVGVGCDGGPDKIPVCGMCGILSDSSYPTGVSLN